MVRLGALVGACGYIERRFYLPCTLGTLVLGACVWLRHMAAAPSSVPRCGA